MCVVAIGNSHLILWFFGQSRAWCTKYDYYGDDSVENTAFSIVEPGLP